ncbi:MAG: MFS transporter [Thermoplasmata archaeon]
MMGTGGAAVGRTLPVFTPGQERSILLLTTIGSLMFAIDSTIVILALPTMVRDLSAPLTVLIWAILLYILIGAALTTQAGRLGDLWGRSRLYNLGFAIFTIGSALCGFAPNATTLIAARALQAVGGSLLFANASAILTYVFPPQRRGAAFGMLALGWGVGAVLGILLGGVITTELGWRYIFFINIPIGIGAVALGLRALPVTPSVRTRFDLVGFTVFTAMLALVSYGAIETAAYGGSALHYSYLVAGALLLPVFVYTELHAAAPMIEVRDFRNRLLSFSLTAGFFQSLGYLSIVFLLTMYLQGVRDLSPLNASLLLVPGYVVGAVAGPLMGRLANRTGTRAMATGGILMMLLGIVGYSLLGVSTWLGWIPIISLVTGVGTGMFFPANNMAIMSQAPPDRLGAISGLRSTLQNMGALLSFVLAFTIASATVPPRVAYAVFLGTEIGGVSGQFLVGLHAALYASAAILGVAAILSWNRGTDPGRSARWTTGAGGWSRDGK